MYRRGLLYGLALSVFLWQLPSRTLPGERAITRDESKNLVQEWLADQGHDVHSSRFVLDADPDQPKFPDFYFFSAAYAQEQSAPTLGHFAVNRKTGDLWDWELCERLQSPAVRSTQKSLRQKMRLSERDYRKFSKISPCSGPT